MRYFVACYGVMGSTILLSNYTTYQPKYRVAQTFLNLLKWNNKTFVSTSFLVAPCLVPVAAITLPILCTMEHFSDKQ